MENLITLCSLRGRGEEVACALERGVWEGGDSTRGSEGRGAGSSSATIEGGEEAVGLVELFYGQF